MNEDRCATYEMIRDSQNSASLCSQQGTKLPICERGRYSSPRKNVIPDRSCDIFLINCYKCKDITQRAKEIAAEQSPSIPLWVTSCNASLLRICSFLLKNRNVLSCSYRGYRDVELNLFLYWTGRLHGIIKCNFTAIQSCVSLARTTPLQCSTTWSTTDNNR